MSTENQTEPLVVSVGGSLIVPDTIDAVFLISFRQIILSVLSVGRQCALVAGGGKIARRFQEVARQFTPPPATDLLDEVGIAATKLNATLLRVLFDDVAEHILVTDPEHLPTTSRRLYIGAGSIPGWSTDYDTVVIAKQLGAKTVLNLSTIPWVADGDKPAGINLESFGGHITWDQYLSLIPPDWKPGMSSPFDAPAARYAQEHGMTVVIMDGQRLENLQAYLDGKEFHGTRITP